MIHVGSPYSPMEQILDLARPGDIVTHAFRRGRYRRGHRTGGQSVRLHPSLFKAGDPLRCRPWEREFFLRRHRSGSKGKFSSHVDQQRHPRLQRTRACLRPPHDHDKVPHAGAHARESCGARRPARPPGPSTRQKWARSNQEVQPILLYSTWFRGTSPSSTRRERCGRRRRKSSLFWRCAAEGFRKRKGRMEDHRSRPILPIYSNRLAVRTRTFLRTEPCARSAR